MEITGGPFMHTFPRKMNVTDGDYLMDELRKLNEKVTLDMASLNVKYSPVEFATLSDKQSYY